MLSRCTADWGLAVYSPGGDRILLEQLLSQVNLNSVAQLVARLLALVFAIPVHEVAHAFVSDKLGDHTARSMGRLTLNPLKHLDVMGLVSMLIIGVGWAKPVPVNPGYYKNRKGGMALTALAGPTSNLLLAYVSTIVMYLVHYSYIFFFVSPYVSALVYPAWLDFALLVLQYFAIVNVTLALFNLIPVPPLDGSRILGVVLPEKIYFGIMKYERYIMLVLLAAVVLLPRLTGFSPLNWLLGPAVDAVLSVLDWLAGFVGSIFSLLYRARYGL